MQKDAIKDLARSGISEAAAEAAGMYTEDSARDVYQDFRKLPCIVIPYYDPETGELMEFERDGEQLPFARIRYLKEPRVRQGFGKKAKPQRYAQPSNSGVFPYFPMGSGVDWGEVLADKRYKIVITEGEKKALAGCLAGVPTIGLGGVFNFMDSGALLPALQRIMWKGRSVYICFDSDAATNPHIMTAEARLAEILALKMGAKVHLVRLPDSSDGAKQGIDDIIQNEGMETWHYYLDTARFMGKVDVEVAKLNEEIAWVEEEGKVLDVEANLYISKDNLSSGSRYSTRHVLVANAKGDGVKKLSVSKAWLTHEHARRYATTVFDPSTLEHTIETERGQAYNLWQGWETDTGDVKPFMRLHEHVFRNVNHDDPDFALKLLAYKFQNPHLKVPMAMVLVGSQGSGKSMWAKMIRLAAGQYGVAQESVAMVSDFNGWMERALIVTMDEALPEHVSSKKGSERFKGWVSEDKMSINEKYRVSRQIKQYAFFILTGNDRRLASFSGDDRRMYVVDAGDKHEDGVQFYKPIADWMLYNNGPQKVCNFLLNYDLDGWVPPEHPPVTREKQIARIENMSPVQRLADEMKTADQNIVMLWLEQAIMSAKIAEHSNDPATAARGRETVDALSRIQVRPYYTPDELAMIFPMIAEQFYGNKRLKGTVAGDISRELRHEGIEYLMPRDEQAGFRVRGRLQNYLIIADMHDIPTSMSQNEFERQMRQFPTYAELTS